MRTKEQVHEYNKRYYTKHKEQLKEANRKYQRDNREKVLAQKRRYSQEHKEEIKIKGRKYYLSHKEQEDATHKRYRERVRVEVLKHYGNGKLCCVRCGEESLPCLSIDHIEGGGTQQRKMLKSQGVASFYAWLRKSGYPEGYQTLCMNCQYKKKDENREYRSVA